MNTRKRINTKTIIPTTVKVNTIFTHVKKPRETFSRTNTRSQLPAKLISLSPGSIWIQRNRILTDIAADMVYAGHCEVSEDVAQPEGGLLIGCLLLLTLPSPRFYAPTPLAHVILRPFRYPTDILWFRRRLNVLLLFFIFLIPSLSPLASRWRVNSPAEFALESLLGRSSLLGCLRWGDIGARIIWTAVFDVTAAEAIFMLNGRRCSNCKFVRALARFFALGIRAFGADVCVCVLF